MITIHTSRLGTLRIQEEEVIEFPHGILGFPKSNRYVLIEREEKRNIAFLQSLNTPSLCFPVTSNILFFGDDYPQPPPEVIAPDVGLDPEDLIVLVIVAVRPSQEVLCANLLAPLLIDAKARIGVQVVLDPERYGTSHPLVFPDIPKEHRDAPLSTRRMRLNTEHGIPLFHTPEQLALIAGR